MCQVIDFMKYRYLRQIDETITYEEDCEVVSIKGYIWFVTINKTANKVFGNSKENHNERVKSLYRLTNKETI